MGKESDNDATTHTLATLISTDRDIRRAEWLAYVKESRRLYRLILILACTLIMVGAILIILATFISKDAMLNFGNIAGFFLDVIGIGGFGFFWNSIRQDTQIKWESINSLQEYDILIEGIIKLVIQIDNKQEKDKLLLEKVGPLLDALITKLQTKK